MMLSPPRHPGISTASGPSKLRRGELAKAQQETGELAKKNPVNPVVQNLEGSVEMATRELPRAQQTFEAPIKAHPDCDAARRNLAEVMLQRNKLDDAKAVLRVLLQRKPNDERVLLMLADIAITQKNTAEAVDRFHAAQAAAPKYPTPGIRLLQLYASQKDWDRAGAAMRSLQPAFPDDPRTISLSGDLRAQEDDYAGAEAAYQQLVNKAPHEPAYALRLAALQTRDGEKTAARATLAGTQAQNPANRTLMGALVSFGDQQSGADAALATAKTVATDDPEEAGLLLAEVLLRAKRTQEALATLEAAQKAAPTGTLVARVGELMYAGGKREEARSKLTAWIKAHDKDVPCRLALAGINMREKKDADARGLYETVLALAPADVVALNNLAVLYGRVNEPRATRLAFEAYCRAPGASTGDTLGWILVTTGKPAEGLQYLRAAAAETPHDGSIQYHLAAGLNAVGKKEEAKQVMKEDGPFDEKADAQHLLAKLAAG